MKENSSGVRMHGVDELVSDLVQTIPPYRSLHEMSCSISIVPIGVSSARC